MRVHGDEVTAEGLDLFIVRRGADDLVDGSVDLQTVVVNDDTEVVQLVVGGKHECFPNLTLLAFTVTDDGIDTVILLVNLCAERHTASGGNALTQGAGGHIYTGGLFHVGMTLQMGIGLAEGFQILNGEIALFGQSGVQNGGGVTFGEHHAVAVGIFGVFRIYLHLRKIEIGDDICDGQGSAGVSCTCGMNALDDAHTDFDGDFLKFGQLGNFHGSLLSECPEIFGEILRSAKNKI